MDRLAKTMYFVFYVQSGALE